MLLAVAGSVVCGMPPLLARSADDAVHDLNFKQGESAIEPQAGTLDPRDGSRRSDAFSASNSTRGRGVKLRLKYRY